MVGHLYLQWNESIHLAEHDRIEQSKKRLLGSSISKCLGCDRDNNLNEEDLFY
jgi:hypothetical protein